MEELIATEIGRRCKRIRMARNMSQPKLAELCNTTAANISKFETKGISDIYWITTISNALGQSLLINESDAEGDVGEVGNEVMRILIMRKGCIRVDSIMHHKLYGLSDSQVTHEIVKLESIGMVVREQYTDFDGKNMDILFITAKGLITLKNRNINSDLQDKYGAVRTYEMLIDEYGNYQEFIENSHAEKLIRMINYRTTDKNLYSLSTPYRANYISYLKANYERGLYSDNSESTNINVLLTNRNCYYDILFRMALGLDNEKLWKYVYSGKTEVDASIEDFLNNESEKGNYDELVSDSEKNFEIDMPWIIKNDYNIDSSDDNSEKDISSEIDSTDVEEAFLYSFLPEQIYNMNKVGKKSPYPTEWFTKEEIVEFIEKNMKAPILEEEIEVEKIIRQINRLVPNTLDYYIFPREWEENGIASLIREIYHI